MTLQNAEGTLHNLTERFYLQKSCAVRALLFRAVRGPPQSPWFSVTVMGPGSRASRRRRLLDLSKFLVLFNI